MQHFRRKISKQLIEFAHKTGFNIVKINYKFQGLANFVGYDIQDINGKIYISFEPEFNHVSKDKWYIRNGNKLMKLMYYKSMSQICKELRQSHMYIINNDCPAINPPYPNFFSANEWEYVIENQRKHYTKIF